MTISKKTTGRTRPRSLAAHLRTASSTPKTRQRGQAHTPVAAESTPAHLAKPPLNSLPASDNLHGNEDERLAYTLPDEHLTPFSRTLRQILQKNHIETARFAKALSVTENTIYRWLNGHAEPRPANLKALLEVLPEHRSELLNAIRQTFPDAPDDQPERKYTLSKEIYQQTLRSIAELAIDQGQLRSLIQQLFDHIAPLLDPQQRGLALTYATVMPPQADGTIHTLREVFTCGSSPWPSHYDDKVFLGRTTLAGHAVMAMRSYTWHDQGEERILVEVDEYERSACACPVTRFGQIGGVLVLSSTMPELFSDAESCAIVEEAACLLGMTLREKDLYAPSLLRLTPMPSLHWQRKQINNTLIDRTLTCMRTTGLPLHEAETRVMREMEPEFEEEGRYQMRHRTSSPS